MQDSENRIETSYKRGFRMFFLIGSIFCLISIPAVWPEVMSKYRGLSGLLWSLYYNFFDMRTLPCLMFLSLPVFCIFLFKKYLYYKQLRVCIDAQGIRLEPAYRAVTWNQVEHILIHPKYSNITLTIRDDPPIYLTRHLKNTTEIFFLVHKYLAPVLLENAMKHFHKQGSLSFGTKVHINNKTLFLSKREQSIPLETISEIKLVRGDLQAKDLNNCLLCSETIESLPDAMIIPDVIKNITSK